MVFGDYGLTMADFWRKGTYLYMTMRSGLHVFIDSYTDGSALIELSDNDM